MTSCVTPPTGDEAPGEVTYAEAASINPFANTMMTVEVTGAQFITLLEQQWQPEGSSRPFLKLGLSDNITYTYDPDAAAGSHITSVAVDGQPIDEAATYTLASGSFLIGGGDNFTVLQEGTNAKDTGLIDTDAFVSYFERNASVDPDFRKQAVAVSGQPSELTAGDEVSFTVSGLDMTSVDSPDEHRGRGLRGRHVGRHLPGHRGPHRRRPDPQRQRGHQLHRAGGPDGRRGDAARRHLAGWIRGEPAGDRHRGHVDVDEHLEHQHLEHQHLEHQHLEHQHLGHQHLGHQHERDGDLHEHVRLRDGDVHERRRRDRPGRRDRPSGWADGRRDRRVRSRSAPRGRHRAGPRGRPPHRGTSPLTSRPGSMPKGGAHRRVRASLRRV
uniref:5'-nucleotidase C-terminal domain-containing protein n=1 Tax=Janibacter limosus TaxID=53458 RepID=A0AC61U512_9MICO|nr:5'-nucleotidase [Janibacter limosus]